MLQDSAGVRRLDTSKESQKSTPCSEWRPEVQDLDALSEAIEAELGQLLRKAVAIGPRYVSPETMRGIVDALSGIQRANDGIRDDDIERHNIDQAHSAE
jgi:hypothetical protein